MMQTPNQLESLERRQLLSYPVTYGSTLYDSTSAVVAMPDGGTVVAGVFSGTADFDPTSGRALLTAVPDEPQMYVARYSSSGALKWVRPFASNEGKLNDNDEIDTAIDPERASGFDFGVGIQPSGLGIYATGIATDASQNIYVTGGFIGSVDFLPGSGKRVLTSGGGDTYVNTFLLRLNGSGGLSYVRQIAGPFTIVANAITLDASRNIYLTGYFTRSANFNLTGGTFNEVTFGREDLFTAKYDNVGRLKWVNRALTQEADRVRRSAGNSLAVDSSGNVFVTGSFTRQTRFDADVKNGPFTRDAVGQTDIFVERLSSSGDIQWVVTYGGDEFDAGRALALSPNGQNVYVGAYFEDTIDINPGPPVRNLQAVPKEPGESPDFTDLMISNFNATNGTLVWGQTLVSGPGSETLGQMKVDSSGNIYATGGFYGSGTDFNPGPATDLITSTPGVEDFHDPNDGDRENSYDVYLTKMTAGGEFQWATTFGSTSDDWGTSLALNPSGQPFVAGQFRGTYFFPNTSKKLRPIGVQDGFIVLFDSDGDLQ